MADKRAIDKRKKVKNFLINIKNDYGLILTPLRVVFNLNSKKVAKTCRVLALLYKPLISKFFLESNGGRSYK
jgi:hypothetical protein